MSAISFFQKSCLWLQSIEASNDFSRANQRKIYNLFQLSVPYKKAFFGALPDLIIKETPAQKEVQIVKEVYHRIILTFDEESKVDYLHQNPMFIHVTLAHANKELQEVIRDKSIEEIEEICQIAMHWLDLTTMNDLPLFIRTFFEIKKEVRFAMHAYALEWTLPEATIQDKCTFVSALATLDEVDCQWIMSLSPKLISSSTTMAQRISLIQKFNQSSKEIRQGAVHHTFALFFDDQDNQVRYSSFILFLEASIDQQEIYSSIANKLQPLLSSLERIEIIGAMKVFPLACLNSVESILLSLVAKERMCASLNAYDWVQQILLEDTLLKRKVWDAWLQSLTLEPLKKNTSLPLAKQIVDHLPYFLLEETHPLAQRAFMLLAQDPFAKVPSPESFFFHKVLQSLGDKITCADLPIYEHEQSSYVLHPKFARECFPSVMNVFGIKKICNSNLPTFEKLLEVIYSMIKRTLSLDPPIENRMHAYVKHRFTFSFEDLMLNLQSHFFRFFLHLDYPYEIPQMHGMVCLLIQSIFIEENTLHNGELLSPREQRCLEISSRLMGDLPGKLQQIYHLYGALPISLRYPLHQEFLYSPHFSYVRDWVQQVVHSMILSLLIDKSTFLQEIKGSASLELSSSRVSLHVRNKIGSHLGLGIHPFYEARSYSCPHEFFQKSTREWMNLFYKHMSIHSLIELCHETLLNTPDRHIIIHKIEACFSSIVPIDIPWIYNAKQEKVGLTEAGWIKLLEIIKMICKVDGEASDC